MMGALRAFILILCLGPCSAWCRAGSVRLKSVAAVDAGDVIRVGDIAALEGEDAAALADVVVVENAENAASGRAWTEVSIADVRRALGEVGAQMSGISLSGATCAVRLRAADSAATQGDNAPPPAARPEVVDLSGPSTVRKQAAASLASLFGVGADHLRLLFDAGDAAFLDEPRPGVNVVVQPTSSAASGRVVLSCRIVNGDRLIDTRTVRAEAEVLRRAVVLHEKVKRKDEIPIAALGEEELWMPAGDGRPVERIEEVAGSLARTRIEAGTVLRAELLDTPIVVKRNELVTVHAVRSGFEVQTRARARADARRGDVIPFRIDGSKNEFMARVERAGVAVMSLDGGGKDGEK